MFKKALLTLTTLASLITVNDRASASESIDPALLRYVKGFLYAGMQPPALEADHYADTGVAYFDKGLLSKSEILADITVYDARWPVRRFELAPGGIDVRFLNLEKPLFILDFQVAYELHNGTKFRSGVIPESICFNPVTNQIIAVANHRFVKE
jgi:hypothetical protein